MTLAIAMLPAGSLTILGKEALPHVNDPPVQLVACVHAPSHEHGVRFIQLPHPSPVPGYGTCDNPQVQGIIVAIPNGGSDKYGVSNPQGANGKINILSSPICH